MKMGIRVLETSMYIVGLIENKCMLRARLAEGARALKYLWR